jgi:hypothetical protein
MNDTDTFDEQLEDHPTPAQEPLDDDAPSGIEMGLGDPTRDDIRKTPVSPDADR